MPASAPDMHDRQDAVAEMERFLLDSIPLARAMQLSIRAWDGDSLALAAPLSPNVNDKGCAFGGSLASLMTLAAWAMLELDLRQAGLEADVFVADAEIRYLAPVFEDLHVTARPLDHTDLERFRTTLRERGKARIVMQADVAGGEGAACRQRARFVAKRRGD